MHWTQVKVSYKPSQPDTAFVQIAEGWEGAPGASMVCPLSSSPCCRTTRSTCTCLALPNTTAYGAHVQVYSVNARTRRIKCKCESDQYEPLNTTEFNTLLDAIVKYVHSTRNQRMREAELARARSAKAAAEREVLREAERQRLAEATQARKVKEEQEAAAEQARKIELLLAQLGEEGQQPGVLPLNPFAISQPNLGFDFSDATLPCLVLAEAPQAKKPRIAKRVDLGQFLNLHACIDYLWGPIEHFTDLKL